MHRHRSATRGLAAALMAALGLWIFRGPMPSMVMHGRLTMATAGGEAVIHAAGAPPGPGRRADSRAAICIGCCPGSSTPPPNPLGLRFDTAPVVLESPAPLAPSLPYRAVEHHWQPQPIGPPAPSVS